MSIHSKRVLNLVQKIDLRADMPMKRWAVLKLLRWQPEARRIRFEERCPTGRCRGKLLMSYVLPSDGRGKWLKDDEEGCGHYCPTCGFSGVTVRLK